MSFHPQQGRGDVPDVDHLIKSVYISVFKVEYLLFAAA
jgi:hypothetical protein